MRFNKLQVLSLFLLLGVATAACSAANRSDWTGDDEGDGGASASASAGPDVDAGSTSTSVGVGGGIEQSGDGGLADCSNPLDLEGCSCSAGAAARTCYSGPAGTENKGTCRDGSQTCVTDGEFAKWGACTGDVLPATEVCSDSLDHNCNGLVGCSDAMCVGLAGCCTAGTMRGCYDGPPGTEGVGSCHGGTQICDMTGAWLACMGEGLPGSELGKCSDGIDNDCNGQTDCKDFLCLLASSCQPDTCTPNTTQPCYDGAAGTAGVGACHGGTQTCAANGKSWGSCVGEVVPAAEGGHCTDGIDNDCSGLTDCKDPACASAVSCCVVTTNPVDGTIWANSQDTLYKIDPTTYDVTTVGSFGVADQITDVAITPNGTLYAISFTSLYQVNKSTAAATFIAPIPGTSNNSLTFLPNGTLLAADSNGDVKSINPNTGNVTAIGNYNSGLISSGDLISIANGTMFGVSSTTQGGGDASSSNVLVRVDVGTGVATAVGPTGYGNVWGLAYAQARVIGFTTAGEILKIDPQTGAATLVSQNNVVFWGAGQSPLVVANACN